MVAIIVLIVNGQGLINTLVQTVVRLESKEYYMLKKKYFTKQRSTLYDSIQVGYNSDKRHRVIWCETKLNS